MHDRRIDAMTDAGVTGARRVIESAQDIASRAGCYVQASVDRVSGRARDLAQDAGHRAEAARETVRSWTTTAHRAVTAHPLQAIAATVGVGYLVGKLLRRR
jgi:ElaB/YqjD/DUF883 family membrane-anchored ribosome-binding protein